MLILTFQCALNVISGIGVPKQDRSWSRACPGGQQIGEANSEVAEATDKGEARKVMDSRNYIRVKCGNVVKLVVGMPLYGDSIN
jgi:hypothetical protein